MQSNDGGMYCVAVGRQSLYANTTGSNVAVGYDALVANTTGSYNTGVGHDAKGSQQVIIILNGRCWSISPLDLVIFVFELMQMMLQINYVVAMGFLQHQPTNLMQ